MLVSLPRPALASCLLIVALGLWASPLQAAGETPRMIALTGAGEVNAVPDIAHVTTGVVTRAKTARDALSANNAAMTAVLKGLAKAGIAEKDIATSQFSVGPEYQHYKDGKPPRVRGYQVSNRVSVKVRDLSRLGDTLDSLVSLGSNTINGIGFSVSEPKPLRNRARELAVEDARAKAELYAKAAGVTLGPILSISEGGGSHPRPVAFARSEALMAADSVPISRGEQTIGMQVRITWEIK